MLSRLRDGMFLFALSLTSRFNFSTALIVS